MRLHKFFITIAFFMTSTIISAFFFILVSALGNRAITPDMPVSSMLLSEKLADEILRFHVIGASDDEYDQELKLLVRNEIIHYIGNLSADLSTKEEVCQLINGQLDTISVIANKVLACNGSSDTVTVRLENKYFPVRTYGSITVPAGYYDSLCIYIGNAEGRNWWCIMFPKLCFSSPLSPFPSDESLQLLQSVLTEEEYSVLTGNDIYHMSENAEQTASSYDITNNNVPDKSSKRNCSSVKVSIKYRFRILELLDELL